jgi:hypothetical protein
MIDRHRPLAAPVATLFALIAIAAALPAVAHAQQRISTPREQLGLDFGDDYFLANYQQIAV